MADIERLIEELEKAEGPSRELDAEIAVALRIAPVSAPEWFTTGFPNWCGGENGEVYCVHKTGETGAWGYAAEFTASIDAALLLVPDGWRWAMDYDPHRGPAYGAAVKQSGDDWPARTLAVNPAIALCIASLKAHAQQKGERDNG